MCDIQNDAFLAWFQNHSFKLIKLKGVAIMIIAFEKGEAKKLAVFRNCKIKTVCDGDFNRFQKVGKCGVSYTDPEDRRYRSETTGILEWAILSHTDVYGNTLLLRDGTLWYFEFKL